MKNTSVLVISDQHAPYSHPDIIAFLLAIKKKYRPDRVVNIGDEADFHALSFHSHDPDLLSPGDELKTAISRMRPLYKMFPKMDLLESNHGSMVYRKGVFNGVPKSAFKTYREILEAPPGWHWHNELTIETSNGKKVRFFHSKGSNILSVSQQLGMSVVCGHHHSSFEIRYWSNGESLNFGMVVGCLIDNDSLAFAYNKISVKYPVIGCGVILKGVPKLLPMNLTKTGRWDGVCP